MSETAITIPCANATCKQSVPLQSGSELLFWTEKSGYQVREVFCPSCSQIHNAPMIKPQPKRTAANYVDGWDV